MARRRFSFERLLLLVTAALHIPVFFAWRGAATRLSWPHPALLAGVVALAAIEPIRGRVRLLQWDRPRNVGQRAFDELYYVHWCAALAAALPISLVGVGYLVGKMVGGWRADLTERSFDTAALGTYGFFFVVALYAVVIRRRWVRLHEVDVQIANLPPAFEGFRIAHLSDLHIGSHTPASAGSRWIKRTNQQAPDLTVVTGDLVTSGTEFYGDVARLLGDLRATEGVFVSLGNHDYFGEGDALVAALQTEGVALLRNTATLLERGGSHLRLAGVDDTWTKRADLSGTLANAPANTPTVLLAHDPILFPPAAELGADLVLSGHTHGGQVAVPFLARRLNLSRITHPHSYGKYTYGKSTLFVHGGLGVTGPPVRLGVPPEVVILTLRAAR